MAKVNQTCVNHSVQMVQGQNIYDLFNLYLG